MGAVLRNALHASLAERSGHPLPRQDSWGRGGAGGVGTALSPHHVPTTHSHTHTCTFTLTFTHTLIYIHILISTHSLQLHSRTSIHTHPQTPSSTCIHTLQHSYTYTLTHMPFALTRSYTHTHTAHSDTQIYPHSHTLVPQGSGWGWVGGRLSGRTAWLEVPRGG